MCIHVFNLILQKKKSSMKISGFTFMRDTAQLYYPFVESILSILPLVDEFVIAIGDCKAGDRTKELVLAIDSPKIKVIDTVWDTETYKKGTVHAQQTDVARFACSGDWLFYLQADEVIHEKYLPIIHKRCEELLNDTQVEGLLFGFRHFFGDYDHFVNSHGWYPQEIRMIRNHPDIHSYISAQSFRRIPNFDGKDYRIKEGAFHLKVAKVEAEVYHYGWVRPPHYMQSKSRVINTTHQGKEKAEAMYEDQPTDFDYGPLGNLPIFKGTHPKVMANKIAQFDWKDQLDYGTQQQLNRPLMKHEKTKNKILTKIEQGLLGGRQLFGYKNWKVIR